MPSFGMFLEHATSQHLAIWKARLAKLRIELIAPAERGGGAGKGLEVLESCTGTWGLDRIPVSQKQSKYEIFLELPKVPKRRNKARCERSNQL